MGFQPAERSLGAVKGTFNSLLKGLEEKDDNLEDMMNEKS